MIVIDTDHLGARMKKAGWAGDAAERTEGLGDGLIGADVSDASEVTFGEGLNVYVHVKFLF